MKTLKSGNRQWALLFLAPGLIGMIVFLFFPILSSLALSFTRWDLLGDINPVGFRNYRMILTDSTFYEALKHTLLFIAGYLPLVIVMALIIAIMLNRVNRGTGFFRAVYFLPVISSWVAVSVIWKWIFNPEYGLLNYFLSLIGIAGPAWLFDPHWALPAVIITSVWKDMGFLMVILLAGMQEIPQSLYEASSIDGAGFWQQTVKITIPMLKESFFFVVVISLINSFQVFDQIWVMTEGGPAGSTSVLVEQIYKNAFKYYKMGYASAMSWILFLIIFAFTVLQNHLRKRGNM